MPLTSMNRPSGSASCAGGTVPSSGGTGTTNGPTATSRTTAAAMRSSRLPLPCTPDLSDISWRDVGEVRREPELFLLRLRGDARLHDDGTAALALGLRLHGDGALRVAGDGIVEDHRLGLIAGRREVRCAVPLPVAIDEPERVYAPAVERLEVVEHDERARIGLRRRVQGAARAGPSVDAGH